MKKQSLTASFSIVTRRQNYEHSVYYLVHVIYGLIFGTFPVSVENYFHSSPMIVLDTLLSDENRKNGYFLS